MVGDGENEDNARRGTKIAGDDGRPIRRGDSSVLQSHAPYYRRRRYTVTGVNVHTERHTPQDTVRSRLDDFRANCRTVRTHDTRGSLIIIIIFFVVSPRSRFYAYAQNVRT